MDEETKQKIISFFEEENEMLIVTSKECGLTNNLLGSIMCAQDMVLNKSAINRLKQGKTSFAIIQLKALEESVTETLENNRNLKKDDRVKLFARLKKIKQMLILLN